MADCGCPENGHYLSCGRSLTSQARKLSGRDGAIYLEGKKVGDVSHWELTPTIPPLPKHTYFERLYQGGFETEMPPDRPYKSQTTSDLMRTLSDQLASGPPRSYAEAQQQFDRIKVQLNSLERIEKERQMGKFNSNVNSSSSSAIFGVDMGAADQQEFNVVYRRDQWGQYVPTVVKDTAGISVAQLQQPAQPKTPALEGPIRWLHRRVAEVCWKPPQTVR